MKAIKTFNGYTEVTRTVGALLVAFLLSAFPLNAANIFYGQGCKLNFPASIKKGDPAQTEKIKAELERITLVYLKSKQLSMEGTMTYYTNAGDPKPVSMESFQMKIKSGCMYSLIKHMERVSNLKYSVTVDKKDKTLIISKGVDLRIKNDPRKIFRQQDMLSSCKNISESPIDADSRLFHFEYENSPFHAMDFQYNIHSLAIEKITIIYDNNGSAGNKVEITYHKTDFKTPLDNAVFTVNRYFTLDKSKKVNVQQAYKEYRIVNQLN